MISIGIDFGTSNSVIAVNNNGLLTIIPSLMGNRIIPSIVSFLNNGEIFVGESARSHLGLKNAHIIFSVKRYLGTDKVFTINNKNYTPIDITSLIIKYIKKQAESYLGQKVDSAVITAPAYFNLNQRQALYQACETAKLHIEDILSEPTSAAVAYGLNQSTDQKIVVYDLGGGTFDVSVIRYTLNKFSVLSVTGDNNLGGDDFDLQIVNLIIKKMKKDYNTNLLNYPYILYQIKDAAEKAKIQLSEEEDVLLPLPFLQSSKNERLVFQLKRSLFESIIQPFIQRTMILMKEAIINAGLLPEEIDRVLLVGGSTRMPLVRKMMNDFFRKEIYLGMNPNECVALCAAIHAHNLRAEKKSIVLDDIIPLSLGIEADGGIFIPIIKRYSRIPAEAMKVFTPAAQKQKKIEIKIYQGERVKTSENIFLGNLIIKNLEYPEDGTPPKIEIKFIVNESGLIKVYARDLLKGNEEMIEIKPSFQASSPETIRIIQKAELMEKDDKNYYYEQKIKVQADEFVKKIKSGLKKTKLSREQMSGIKELLKEIKKAKQAHDLNKLEEIIQQQLDRFK